MLPASLGPPSKESIKFTECLQWQIQSNRLFLTVMTKQRYRGKQLFFFRNMRNERKNWSLQRQFISEEKFQKFTFMLPFFPSLFPFSLCLLSKTTWANIASCHIKAIFCLLQRGRILLLDGAAQLADTWPTFAHMRCKDGGGGSIWTRACVLRTNLLKFTEGGFPHYNRTSRYEQNA